MSDLEFWENVYIAAMRSGKRTPVEAANAADMGVAFRRRWQQLEEERQCRNSSK